MNIEPKFIAIIIVSSLGGVVCGVVFAMAVSSVPAACECLEDQVEFLLGSRLSRGDRRLMRSGSVIGSTASSLMSPPAMEPNNAPCQQR